MKISTPVSKFMTSTPISISASAMLSTADETMRAHGIRHLPVLQNGLITGVVSQRDITLIEALEGVDRRAVPVSVAMTPVVYTALPSTPIREVAAAMADYKYGSCVIAENSVPVGILTTTDICRALAELTAPSKKTKPQAAMSSHR